VRPKTRGGHCQEEFEHGYHHAFSSYLSFCWVGGGGWYGRGAAIVLATKPRAEVAVIFASRAPYSLRPPLSASYGPSYPRLGPVFLALRGTVGTSAPNYTVIKEWAGVQNAKTGFRNT